MPYLRYADVVMTAGISDLEHSSCNTRIIHFVMAISVLTA